MCPLLRFTIWETVESPRPVPLPGSLVVKSGFFSVSTLRSEPVTRILAPAILPNLAACAGSVIPEKLPNASSFVI